MACRGELEFRRSSNCVDLEIVMWKRAKRVRHNTIAQNSIGGVDGIMILMR